MQTLLVTLLVSVCFIYAVWALAPRVLRRWLALRLLKWPLPAALQKPLNTAARLQGGGCGCDGCDAPAASGTKPMIFVRKR